ncbi:MAG: hypothetical protein AAGB02_09000 [Pseudomonadota bacterium]
MSQAALKDDHKPAIELVIKGDIVRDVANRQQYLVQDVSYFETWDGFEIDYIACRKIGAGPNSNPGANDYSTVFFKPSEVERLQ